MICWGKYYHSKITDMGGGGGGGAPPPFIS